MCDSEGAYTSDDGCEAWDSSVTGLVCCSSSEATNWTTVLILVIGSGFFALIACILQVLIVMEILEKERMQFVIPGVLFLAWGAAAGAYVSYFLSEAADAANYEDFSALACNSSEVVKQEGGLGSFAIVLSFLISFMLQWTILCPACCGSMMTTCEMCVEDDGFAK